MGRRCYELQDEMLIEDIKTHVSRSKLNINMKSLMRITGIVQKSRKESVMRRLRGQGANDIDIHNTVLSK